MEYASFPKYVWRKTSGRYGQYGSDSHFLIHSRNARDESSKFFKDGFLTYYGTTSLMEDMNTYAEYLFMEHNRLKVIGKDYPSVEKKRRILIQFYCSLDKKMKRYIDCDI